MRNTTGGALQRAGNDNASVVGQEPRAATVIWLPGPGDPLIGRALALLHADPARRWTLRQLAAEAGASRSLLAGRFSMLMGRAPMQYLTQWRMQLAADRLKNSGVKIATVAQEVGYDSEAAFSRAFKRFAGESPGQWRCRRKTLGAGFASGPDTISACRYQRSKSI